MLVLLAVLREWRRHPWQILLSLVGVAIGVAVVVAVDIANVSAEREFERANRALEGIATHRVAGAAAGIDEALYTRLKVELAVREAAPVVRGDVLVDGDAFTLIGIDPVSDYRLRDFRLYSGDVEPAPFPLFVSPDLAARRGLDPGDRVRLSFGREHREFQVAGTLGGGSGAALPANVLVTDIAAAQVFLGMIGRLSYVDLRLETGERVELVETVLPAGVRLVSTEARNRARFDMTRAFRINLTALGLLALVIGLFLIYNTVSFQVVRRRPLFGLLRALGVTPNALFAYLAAEAAVIAAIGVAAGLLLGVALSQFLYAMVTGTIDALYFDLAKGVVTLDPLTVAKSAGLGALATMLAAGVPALEARRTPPRGLMTRSSQESPVARYRRIALASVIAVGASLVVLWVSGESLQAAFLALFLLILGGSGLAPLVVLGVSRALAAPASSFALPAAAMAARNMRAHLSRTGVAASALSVAVAATLGVGLMIDSFRTSVEDWLRSYLRADIYISLPQEGGASFSPEFIASLHDMGGVDAVSLGRRVTVEDPVHGPVELFLLDTTREGFEGFQVKSGDTRDLWQRFSTGGEVLVSEPFARRFSLSPGDEFELLTDRGREALSVAAVYFDYSTDRGVLALSPSTFERFFDPVGYRAASLYLDEGDDEAVARALAEFERNLNPDGLLYARSNRELRDMSMVIFDQTFKVTGILRLLAIVVAVTGIISALMALELERAREYAMLRAAGFTRAQLGAQVLAETGATGLAAGLLSVPIGLALSVLLIRVINVRSFGWSMQTVVDPVLVMQAVALSVGAALVAGIYPALRLRAIDIARSLRND